MAQTNFCITFRQNTSSYAAEEGGSPVFKPLRLGTRSADQPGAEVTFIMMHFMFGLIIIFCSLPTVFAAPAPATTQWMAIRMKGQSITSAQIAKFLEDTLLGDPMKIALFSLAGGDYERYEVEKQRWIQKNFDVGLRTMGYLAHVQSTGMIDSALNGGQAFQLPTGTALKILQDREQEVLKPYMDKEGIQSARIKYAKFLMQSRYPHRPQQDAESLYWDWYKAEEQRIMERLRIRAVMEWLVVRAGSGLPKTNISPFDFQPFIEKTKMEIHAAFTPSVRSPEQVRDLMDKHQHFQALLKKVDTLDPAQLVLSDLVNSAPNAVTALPTQLAPVFDDRFLHKLLAWEEKAVLYAREHPDAEKLRGLARKSLDEFFSQGGDERQFILARILSLSAILVENKIVRDPLRAAFKTSLAAALGTLQAELADPARIIAGYGKESLEAAVVNIVRSSLENHAGEHSRSIYYREVEDLAVSVIRLEVKRFIYQQRPLPKLEFFGKNDPELYTRVRKALERQRIHDALTALHENELRWSASATLELFPRPGEAIRGDRVWDYCQENSFRNELLEVKL